MVISKKWTTNMHEGRSTTVVAAVDTGNFRTDRQRVDLRRKVSEQRTIGKNEKGDCHHQSFSPPRELHWSQ